MPGFFQRYFLRHLGLKVISLLLAIGLWSLGILARPFTRWRLILLSAMAGAFALTVAIPGVRHFFALDVPPAKVAGVVVVAVCAAALVLEMSRRVFAGDY